MYVSILREFFFVLFWGVKRYVLVSFKVLLIFVGLLLYGILLINL